MALNLKPLTVVCTKTLFDFKGRESFTEGKEYKTDGYIDYYNTIPEDDFTVKDNQNLNHCISINWKQHFKTK
jgi:hypothetical protein